MGGWDFKSQRQGGGSVPFGAICRHIQIPPSNPTATFRLSISLFHKLLRHFTAQPDPPSTLFFFKGRFCGLVLPPPSFDLVNWSMSPATICAASTPLLTLSRRFFIARHSLHFRRFMAGLVTNAICADFFANVQPRGPWGHGQAPVCNCYIMQRVSGSSLRGLDPQWCRFCSVSQVSACSKTRTGFSRLLDDGFHQDAARRFWCCYWGLLLELNAPVGWGCL